jgi:hypothetical protein
MVALFRFINMRRAGWRTLVVGRQFVRHTQAKQEDMPRCFQDGGVWVFARN